MRSCLHHRSWLVTSLLPTDSASASHWHNCLSFRRQATRNFTGDTNTGHKPNNCQALQQKNAGLSFMVYRQLWIVFPPKYVQQLSSGRTTQRRIAQSTRRTRITRDSRQARKRSQVRRKEGWTMIEDSFAASIPAC